MVAIAAIGFSVPIWLGDSYALSGAVAAILLAGYTVHVGLTGMRTCYVRAVGRPGSRRAVRPRGLSSTASSPFLSRCWSATRSGDRHSRRRHRRVDYFVPCAVARSSCRTVRWTGAGGWRRRQRPP